MKVKVFAINGKETGREIELPEAFFGIEPNDHAIYLDVKQYLANQRQATHKSKERAEIKGSTKKLRKQKGSGAARIGSVKSPVLRGGGRVFGPRADRDYSFKLNKKLKALARKSALTYRAKAKEIMVIEDIRMDVVKSKDFVNVFNSLEAGVKSVFVANEVDANLYLSSRNVQEIKVTEVAKLNTYDILNCKKLIFAESSLEYFNK